MAHSVHDHFSFPHSPYGVSFHPRDTRDKESNGSRIVISHTFSNHDGSHFIIVVVVVVVAKGGAPLDVCFIDSFTGIPKRQGMTMNEEADLWDGCDCNNGE